MTERGTFIINGAERVITIKLRDARRLLRQKDKTVVALPASLIPNRGRG